MFIWTVVLFVRGHNSRRQAPQQNQQLADEFTWVFMVPALNEEVTIADSVERLLAVEVSNKRIIVIDDGSEDSTPQILAEISHPALIPLRRNKPAAQTGKAAALNWTYRQLDKLLGDTDPSRVIVVIVDADGRLHTDAPSWIAGHFADPQVGGVQSQVRIYNRRKLLAWFQDIEFGVYGALFQSGRNTWGTAGMGGNGQFNRLSALRDVADETGPWRDKLTEDQDLGLRLLGAGWLGHQELRATVDQQGLSKLRPLLRQRTRWSQGNLQAMSLLGTVARSPRSRVARFESMLYLLMPIWQSIIGI
ncbi:MAG: glycosyltransferase [Solirubrobacterales bacterium]